MLGAVNGAMGKWGGEKVRLHRGTVLVVDDEPESLELMRALLASQGFVVRTAESSEAAMPIVEHDEVDLVVCDLMMARMDGVELCAYIRETLALAHLPIVFVTSLHDRASRIRAKEAGADDFLVKPVDGLELLVRVESLLQTRASIERAHSERNLLLVELSKLRELLLGDDELAADQPAPHALVALLRAHREDLELLARNEAGASHAALERLCVSARALEAHALLAADTPSHAGRSRSPRRTRA